MSKSVLGIIYGWVISPNRCGQWWVLWTNSEKYPMSFSWPGLKNLKLWWIHQNCVKNPKKPKVKTKTRDRWSQLMESMWQHQNIEAHSPLLDGHAVWCTRSSWRTEPWKETSDEKIFPRCRWLAMNLLKVQILKARELQRGAEDGLRCRKEVISAFGTWDSRRNIIWCRTLIASNMLKDEMYRQNLYVPNLKIWWILPEICTVQQFTNLNYYIKTWIT